MPLFAVLGAWVPYWPLWLADRGATETEIGVLLSATIWARALTTPWFASLADRSGRRRRMLVALGLASIACFLPFAWAEGFVALLVPSLLFGIAFPPLIPLADGLTVLQARHTPGLSYARIRLFGSLAFLATALGLGMALENAAAEVVRATIVVGLLLAAAAGFALPDPPADDHAHGGRDSRPIRHLLGDRRFVAVLACTGLIQASHAAYYAFSSVHWQAAGIDEGTIGLLWAEAVVAEILLFAGAAGLADRLGPARLFRLGAAAAILRWAVLATTVEVGLLAATNWLHALSFGATHLAAVGYVAQRVPRAYAATAQSLLSAIATGAATAVATMWAGAVYGRSAGLAFGSMAALAAAGALFAGRLARLNGDAGRGHGGP